MNKKILLVAAIALVAFTGCKRKTQISNSSSSEPSITTSSVDKVSNQTSDVTTTTISVNATTEIVSTTSDATTSQVVTSTDTTTSEDNASSDSQSQENSATSSESEIISEEVESAHFSGPRI